MKYTDLATRLEDLDNQLSRNFRDAQANCTRITSLEAQVENARKKHRKIESARLALLDQRETTKRELNARLG